MTNQTPKRPDYTGGDHSAKNWFKIMWGNHYIQLFTLFFTLFILQLINLKWCVEVWNDCNDDGVIGTIAASIGMAIPIAGTLIILFKGFIQFWNDLKSGNSR
jgi:hypothetical protein